MKDEVMTPAEVRIFQKRKEIEKSNMDALAQESYTADGQWDNAAGHLLPCEKPHLATYCPQKSGPLRPAFIT